MVLSFIRKWPHNDHILLWQFPVRPRDSTSTSCQRWGGPMNFWFSITSLHVFHYNLRCWFSISELWPLWGHIWDSLHIRYLHYLLFVTVAKLQLQSNNEIISRSGSPQVGNCIKGFRKVESHWLMVLLGIRFLGAVSFTRRWTSLFLPLFLFKILFVILNYSHVYVWICACAWVQIAKRARIPWS